MGNSVGATVVGVLVGVIVGVEVGTLLGLEVVAMSIDLLSNRFTPAVPTLSTVANAIVLAVFVLPALAVAVTLVAVTVTLVLVVFTAGGSADLLALLVPAWDVVVADLLALAAGEGTGTGGGAADLPDLA